MGTKNKTYDEFARELGLVSGGLNFSVSAQTRQDKLKKLVKLVFLNSKCLEQNIGKMMELIKELLLDYSFDNKSKLRELTREYLARFEADIIQNGHHYSSLLANRGFSESQFLNENWHGISQLMFFKKYISSSGKNYINKLSKDLENLADHILIKNRIKFALIGSEQGMKKGLAYSELIQAELIKKTNVLTSLEIVPKSKFKVRKIHEGWVVASAVSFSACSFKSLVMTHKDSPVLAVISKILTMSYLLKELREKRGAYGGFAKFNPQESVFSLGSYRDPHVFSTINVYKEAFEYIKKETFNDTDIKEAILSIVSEIDKPDTPAVAAQNAFRRQLIALSDKDRLNFKKRLIKVTKSDVSRVAKKYFKFQWFDLSMVFIGGEDNLKKANKKLGKNKLEINKINKIEN